MSESGNTEVPAAAWYPDPNGSGLRYWDGATWTEHTHQPPQFACLVCGHNRFRHGSYMLNTRGLTFFGLDWFNDAATCVVCESCGFIHWFAPPTPG